MREKKSSEPIKVTDKRIFTSEGEIREEFKNNVTPAVPAAEPPKAAAPPQQTKTEQEKKPARDRSVNPGTPFTMFIESLVVQAYMSLGMLRNPYGQVPVDVAAARQLVDIITMLSEKTKGNLSEDEEEYLKAHLAELKLAYVQRSKTI